MKYLIIGFEEKVQEDALLSVTSFADSKKKHGYVYNELLQIL